MLRALSVNCPEKKTPAGMKYAMVKGSRSRSKSVFFYLILHTTHCYKITYRRKENPRETIPIGHMKETPVGMKYAMVNGSLISILHNTAHHNLPEQAESWSNQNLLEQAESWSKQNLRA